MSEIVEVFWDASPALKQLGLKVGSGTLDPRADALFAEVRAAAANAFPDAVTLLRIEVRRDSEVDLRVVRNGVEEPAPAGLRAMINHAVDELATGDGPRTI